MTALKETATGAMAMEEIVVFTGKPYARIYDRPKLQAASVRELKDDIQMLAVLVSMNEF